MPIRISLIKAIFSYRNIKINRLKSAAFLITFILFIFILGSLSIYSSGGKYFLYKHLTNSLISLICSAIVFSIDTEYLFKLSYLFYLISLGLLISVELFGTNIMGATRWLNLGFIQFQPSEIAKLGIIIFLANCLGIVKNKINNIKILSFLVLSVSIPIFLIIKQPDLGTGSIIIFICGILFLLGNLSWKIILISLIGILSFSPLIWRSLYEYQRKRILIFLFNNDKLNSGYNVYQSQIAIGSGGYGGMGFRSGSQTQLGFLPENHTDFIFSSFAEEFGLVYCLLLILAYFCVTSILWYMSFCCKDKRRKLLIAGIASLFFFHFYINISMVMGLLPVVGIPLPIFSYGGASLITVLLGISIATKAYLTDS